MAGCLAQHLKIDLISMIRLAVLLLLLLINIVCPDAEFQSSDHLCNYNLLGAPLSFLLQLCCLLPYIFTLPYPLLCAAPLYYA